MLHRKFFTLFDSDFNLGFKNQSGKFVEYVRFQFELFSAVDHMLFISMLGRCFSKSFGMSPNVPDRIEEVTYFFHLNTALQILSPVTVLFYFRFFLLLLSLFLLLSLLMFLP